MIITVTQRVPIYRLSGEKSIDIDCACSSVNDFYQGFYDQFEHCAPLKRGQYSMPDHLVAGYEKWKRDNKRETHG